MSAQRTVLFHPLNHIGLGHINRLSVIALAIRRIDETIRTPFVIEEASHILLDALALPYVPLPSSHAMTESAAWATWTAAERSDLQSHVSRLILRTLAPQIVVFDCLPSPVFSAVVVEAGVPIVLCLREMRDLGGYVTHVRVLLEHVSLIVVPHAQGAFSLPEELAAKSCFVGQIARPAARLAKSVHEAHQPRVLVSGGGGGYPGTSAFYNLAMKAIAELRGVFPGLKGELIAGPLFRDWLQLQPVDGIPLIPFEPDTATRFSESDLVICQAGYNTVAELEQLGTRTILVPAERQWDDQFARADRVSRERKNFRVFRGTSPSQLAALASEFLREEIPDSAVPESDGGIKAARLIHKMLK